MKAIKLGGGRNLKFKKNFLSNSHNTEGYSVKKIFMGVAMAPTGPLLAPSLPVALCRVRVFVTPYFSDMETNIIAIAL